MGEIADMMLEGILCQCCGTYLGEGDGFPLHCAGCKPDTPKKPKRSGKEKIHPDQEIRDWANGMRPDSPKVARKPCRR